MTRQTKTPRQRAEEALASGNRLVVRLDRKVEDLKSQLVIAERDHRIAIRRRDYLAQHPDLPGTPEQDSTTNQSGDTAP